MRRYYKFGRRPKKQKIKYPINYGIRAREVRVIDDEGKMLGVMPTAKAIEMAKEKGYDLIAVSPKAQPPVAKFADYGKLQYEQEKLLKKQKSTQKKVEVKGIRLSSKISSHDLEMRKKQAEKFLEKGDKIKVEIILRGREHKLIAHAREIINKFIKNLSIDYIIEQELSKQGSKLTAVVAPKK